MGRKMCVVLQRDLGKGDAALSRCIPLAIALHRHRAGESATGETSLSPNPIDKGDCSSPFEPIASDGDFILPRHPHDQPFADWMRRKSRRYMRLPPEHGPCIERGHCLANSVFSCLVRREALHEATPGGPYLALLRVFLFAVYRQHPKQIGEVLRWGYASPRQQCCKGSDDGSCGACCGVHELGLWLERCGIGNARP